MPEKDDMVEPNNKAVAIDEATMKVVSGYSSSSVPASSGRNTHNTKSSRRRRAVDESDNESIDGEITSTVKDSQGKTETVESGGANSTAN